MAEPYQTPEGVWTNAPQPLPALAAGEDPNKPFERDGVLYQRTPGGHELAIGSAHNTPVAEPAHPEVEAQDWLNSRTQPAEVQRQQAIDAQVERDKAEELAARQNSPIGKVANWLTPDKIAAVGLGGTIAAPEFAPVIAAGGAGLNALASLLRTHYDEPNAPQSGNEFLGGELEAASPGLLGAAGNAVAPYVSKAISAAPKTISGLGGAAVGGYEGYKRGGVLGGLEGAAAGGVLGAGVPKSLQVLKSILGAAPEAAAAEETVPFAKPGFQSAEVPGSQYRETWQPTNPGHAAPFAPDTSIDPTIPQFGYGPESGVYADKELNPQAIERLRRAAQPTTDAVMAAGDHVGPGRVNQVTPGIFQDQPPPPDLMDEYVNSLKGGQGSGKQSFEMGGVKYAPDETGSHKALKDVAAGVTQAEKRLQLANTPPAEIDNPVASRTLNELRTERAQGNPNPKAERQAQMRRRLQGGGR